MKRWLKTHWRVFSAAIVAALAIYAAARHKASAQKWQETSVDIEAGKVVKGTLTAEAASTRAKLHDAKADEIKAKAEQRVGKQNETTADILKSWGS